MPSNLPMYSLRMQEEDFLKMKVISKNESRSVNKQIEFILKKFITQYEAEHGEIKVNPDDLYE